MKMNKKHLTVKKLDMDNLQDVIKLQQKIINGLHPDEQHFILHRTKEDYIKSLNGKSSNMLGVFDQNELIAQTIFIMRHGTYRNFVRTFQTKTSSYMKQFWLIRLIVAPA